MGKHHRPWMRVLVIGESLQAEIVGTAKSHKVVRDRVLIPAGLNRNDLAVAVGDLLHVNGLGLKDHRLSIADTRASGGTDGS